MASLSTPHEPNGPIRWPMLGPTLLNEDMASPKASSSDKPMATMAKVDSMMSMK